MSIKLGVLAGANGEGGPKWHMPGGTHLWRANKLNIVGGVITGIRDSIGGLTLASIGTAPPTLTTLGAQNKEGFKTNPSVSCFLSALTFAPEVMTSGAIAMVLKVGTYAPGANYYVGGAKVTSGGRYLSQFSVAGSQFARFDADGAGATIGQTSSPMSSPLLRTVVWTWGGGNAFQYFDGTLVSSSAAAPLTIPNIVRWDVAGVYPGSDAQSCFDTSFGEVRTGRQLLSLPDVTNFQNYFGLYYN